ncbi:MAG TPA: hypothetical protein VHB50_12275, partial [Bryobacteraceae bacterium]|nr:hypothetical protein [Bryobacteraceae bacterium]
MRKVLPFLLVVLCASPAVGGFSVFQTYTGDVGVSTDGCGSVATSNCTIQAQAPAGSSVIAAYLYSAYSNNLGVNDTGSLNGSPIPYSTNVSDTTGCCQLGSRRADVTSIVKPLVDNAGGAVITFNVHEDNTFFTDGEALVVVYSDPSRGASTVSILDGFSSRGGDSVNLSFATPLDPMAPGFMAQLLLGDSFSCCRSDNPPNQFSDISVDGSLMSGVAGNNDDCQDASPNFIGCLITVGSTISDPFTPVNPTYQADHERYSLVSEIHQGDNAINLALNNPSADDNLFLAVVNVSAGAVSPEP